MKHLIRQLSLLFYTLGILFIFFILIIMLKKVHYGTVTEAINSLRSKGFNLDFNLEANCLVCNTNKYEVDDFDIVDVYRYEGNSDPADEAAVYAIESKNGEKGILVTGYGMSADEMSTELLAKLSDRQQ